MAWKNHRLAMGHPRQEEYLPHNLDVCVLLELLDLAHQPSPHTRELRFWASILITCFY